MKSTTVLAEESLNVALRQSWIEEVRLSDTWYVRFSNDLWFAAYEVELSTERSLRVLLSSSAPALLAGVDADNVPKMACLCALMREKITGCHIDADGSFRILFERGGELRADTSIQSVDWFWYVGSSPGDPYQTPSIAHCLSVGEVALGSLGGPTSRSPAT